MLPDSILDISTTSEHKKTISSGVVEGLNSKTKVTMRKSYGFRKYRVLKLALYHSLGKLPEPESASSRQQALRRRVALIGPVRASSGFQEGINLPFSAAPN
jgi:hypothetical protein